MKTTLNIIIVGSILLLMNECENNALSNEVRSLNSIILVPLLALSIYARLHLNEVREFLKTIL